jgi:hypothetical protein
MKYYIILILTMTNILLFTSLFFLKEFKECYPDPLAMPIPNVTNNLKFESIKAYVTMYSKLETCPNKTCINAMGQSPRSNHSVACPRRYELGSVVIIRGKTYFCDDRTAPENDGRFDLYGGDTEEHYLRAKEFGKQFINLTILK